MSIAVFSSSTVPKVSIYLSEKVREHLQRHFNTDMLGSKFFFKTQDSLFKTIVNNYPDLIRKSICNENGFKVISIQFESVIGYCNVASIDELSEEELSSMKITQRGETKVRCITSNRLNMTKDCQLILDRNNNIVTAYPGELAPPLPTSLDIHDAFWDHHVFIECTKE